MSQVRTEAFAPVPPCSGRVAVRRLLKEGEGESEFGDHVEGRKNGLECFLISVWADLCGRVG